MLADSKLPTTFWAKAVSTACYVQIRVLVVKPHNKTPYELFRGFKPALSFMRPFGCHVTILNTLDNLGKFDGKSDEGFFVGYSVSIAASKIINESAGTQGELNAGTLEEISQDCIMMPIWKDASYFDSPSKDVDIGEPKSDADDQKHVEDGLDNENDEKDKFEDDSSTKEVNDVGQHVNTASLEVNTVDPLVNTASSNNQESPKDMFKMGASHTLEATHVEFFSDEDEPKVELWNILNSYTVPTTSNTRIHKDHPIENVIGDVKTSVQTRRMTKPTSKQGFLSASAFLYGTIKEEVYVTQPPGFKDPGHPDKVYKVYVDDIIFGSTNKELCTRFKKLMMDMFQMSSMGELTFFLGLQVAQKEDGIFINQDKYVAEILKKFNYTDVKSASTSVDLEKPLVKDGDADDVDVHLYRSMIGSLMYLTASRPDIMFAVCACARFQVTLKISHLLAVKRIFRYLKGKPTLGLLYSRDSPFELVAYTDSDYAGATQDKKSTTGG
ncbi:putative ribonuclease H-like domain-containing protein, partial [Tanacetum coccineum]